MATVTASTLNRFPTTDKSYVYRDQASVTATPATGDIWRFFVIPAGTEIQSVTIQNADLGTAAPLDLGFAPVDGSSGTATAFLSAYAAGTAAATGVTYLLATPVKVEVDSFMQAKFGTINTGAEGAVTLAATGILLGAK